MSRAVDFNAIAAFAKVIELKSFRAAAKALDVPKSTISLKVAQLEDRLGARLLERTTRALRPTDAGLAYYRQIASAFETLHDAEQIVSDMQAQPSGTLRITAPIELGQLVLGEVLAEYVRRYPEVVIEVELMDRRVSLVDEGFDVALRPGELPDSTLIARKLGRPQSLRLYASPDYLRRRGEPRHPNDLADHVCLAMSSHLQPTTWQFRIGRKTTSLTVEPRVMINSHGVLRDLAVAGIGIVRLPEILGAVAVESGALRAVLDDFCPPPSLLYAVYPNARNTSPKVRALLEILDEYFEHWPNSEPGTRALKVGTRSAQSRR